jgi:hypothetical protein
MWSIVVYILYFSTPIYIHYKTHLINLINLTAYNARNGV